MDASGHVCYIFTHNGSGGSGSGRDDGDHKGSGGVAMRRRVLRREIQAKLQGLPVFEGHDSDCGILDNICGTCPIVLHSFQMVVRVRV